MVISQLFFFVIRYEISIQWDDFWPGAPGAPCGSRIPTVGLTLATYLTEDVP